MKITATAEAKARAFADRVIAERAPAGEAGDALPAFITACRYVSGLAARKVEDRHLASWERNYWRVVRRHAGEREITATNNAIAADQDFDRMADEISDAAFT